jgi:hypothetical protein
MTSEGEGETEEEMNFRVCFSWVMPLRRKGIVVPGIKPCSTSREGEDGRGLEKAGIDPPFSPTD